MAGHHCCIQTGTEHNSTSKFHADSLTTEQVRRRPRPETSKMDTKKSSTGSLTLASGKPDDTWSRYDLYQVPLHKNGAETKYKAIIQRGDIAQIATSQYTLLPNEEAVKVADATAEQMGLVPFTEFTGSWFQRMENHVVLDGFKAHALYAINKPYEVNGDEMHLGVGVHNSIDGTTSFGAGVFTFRNACRNMVLAGSKGYPQDFDQRRTLEYVYKRHTSAIDPVVGELSQVIARIMDRAQGILEAYRGMAEQKATEKYILDLAKKLEGSRLLAKVYPSYLLAEPDKAATLNAEPETVWDVYNDFTANIWHNDATNMRIKIFHFDNLHRILPIQAR